VIFLESFLYHLPTKIIFGRGGLSKIGEVVSQYGKKVFLITMSDFATKYGFTEYILERISEKEIPLYMYDEVEVSPTEKGLKKILDIFLDSGCDQILAFGGGSVIDSAKAVSLAAKLGGNIGDYYYPNVVEKELFPVIAVPTTCGTGSEVTKYAIITEDSSKKKKTILGDPLIPRVALLDADTLKPMPPSLIASTGSDVLCHAVESFLGKKHSPFSDLYSAEASKVAFENIIKAYGGEEDAKEYMLYAACLGGAAINTTGTTVAHALGYYISSKYNIPHGVATIMFLPHILSYEIEDIRKRLEELALLSGFQQKDAEYFVRKIRETLDQIGIAKKLGDLGIKEEEKSTIVQEGLSFKRNLENNIVELDENDLLEIVGETL
jgi:alcohol dehydrogenase